MASKLDELEEVDVDLFIALRKVEDSLDTSKRLYEETKDPRLKEMFKDMTESLIAAYNSIHAASVGNRELLDKLELEDDG